MLLVLPLTTRAGGVVTTCTEVALRAAMSGGGTVTFDCDGTITLANTISNNVGLILDGNGHQVTISGNSSVRVFYVNTNAVLTLLNLSIAQGWATDGGGLFNDGARWILPAARLSLIRPLTTPAADPFLRVPTVGPSTMPARWTHGSAVFF